MSALTIINGIYKEELHEQAERYAFREGLRTRSLELFLQENGSRDDSVILVLTDGEALKKLKKDLFLVLSLRFPVIFVPDSALEWSMVRQRLESAGCRTLYPFQYDYFCEVIRECVDPKIWRERTCIFGRVEICPANRMVRLNGTEVRMRQVDFDILLILLENLDRVVTRQYINDRLPQQPAEYRYTRQQYPSAERAGERYPLRAVSRILYFGGSALQLLSFRCRVNLFADEIKADYL